MLPAAREAMSAQSQQREASKRGKAIIDREGKRKRAARNLPPSAARESTIVLIVGEGMK